jgi:hypothetical protein
MLKIIIAISVLAIPVASTLAGEISDDGHLVAETMDAPGRILVATDDVPLPDTPDYQCNLRMQVGGLDFADFDSDGDLDLAVGCYHSQSYPPYEDWRNFLLVNNDGELEAEPSWWSSDERSTTDVKWADFNGDEYLDLFACNGDFSFDPSVIYFGTPDGLNETPEWVVNDDTWTLFAAPFDIDQDGDTDVATANQGASPDPYRHIYIYHNNGQGLPLGPTWQSGDEMITNFIDWGDMDGDGWFEMATSKWSGFESGVYGNLEGEITYYPIWVTDSTGSQKGIGWADTDHDTFPELAIGGTGPTVLYDNIEGELGPYPFWTSVNSFHGCQDLKWVDIDSDGDPDLATVHFSNGHVRVYLNIDGTLESEPSWVYDSNGAGTALAFGDVNGDDLPDLAMGQSGDPAVQVFLNTSQTSVDDEPVHPDKLSLSQNYPNPFNASTTIKYTLPTQSDVRIEIYNILGQGVATLFEGNRQAGYHTVTWQADNYPSGVYFARLQAGGRSENVKMVLLK